MTITFPRDFLFDGKFSDECSFELVYQQAQAITGGGSPNVADLGPAMWQGEFSTYANSREDYGAWAAWLSSLRGGLRLFKGRPALRKWPLAYPKGFTGLLYSGSQWSGLGNLQTIGAGRDTITVNQLPNGLVLKPGDYLSIPVGTKQHIHRVVEGAVSSSNAATVAIEPTIRPGVVTGIAVKFEAPYCDMALLGKPTVSRSGTRGGQIKFTGLQVLI